jgi:16S rRNA (guanine1207-N2)-methyltransferase
MTDNHRATADGGYAFDATIDGVDLHFETRPTLFSPRGVDAGTRAMLECVRFEPFDKVLDLGCGYGVVGVFAAKRVGADRVFMIDSDPTAVDGARHNARLNDVAGVTVVRSDAFEDFREVGFTKILCNPPYHADFAVPKRFILKGFNRLAFGGALWMVTRRAAWYRNKLVATFGRVAVHPVGSYVVFEATKRSNSYANAGRRAS